MINQFFQGMAIGIANIIPGVSGGTIAVVLGIYDELITAINNVLTTHPLKNKKNIVFLAKIALGVFTGIFIFARLIDYLLTQYPIPTYFFFIGLIIGTIPIVYKMNSAMEPTVSKILTFLIAAGIVIAVTLIPTSVNVAINPGNLSLFAGIYLFLSGIIAAATMVIPGISGSFMLLLMGSYHSIIQAVSNYQIGVLAIVAVGAILGIIISTKAIYWLLKHVPSHTHYAILGLLAASAIKLWPGFTLDITGFIALALLAGGTYLGYRLN